MSLSAKDRAKLAELGFDVTGKKLINTLKRVIMSITGPWKGGKTGFGLGVTPPVAYINLDRRIEDATLRALGIPTSNIIPKELRFDRDEAQDVQKKKWEEIYDFHMWALREADSIRSIVYDTESQLWELCRLAHFGKVKEVVPHQYTVCNNAYNTFLGECDKYNKNVIFLRHMKKEYKNAKWTGKYEAAGFSKLEGVVQVNGFIERETVWNEDKERDEQEFTFTIKNNGLKAGLNGVPFKGSMCSFKWVASMLTDTLPTDWE